MTDGLAVFDELGSLAEVGVSPCGVDEGADLTLAHDRCRKYRVARTACGGQRFTGQRRLVHLDRISLEQSRVSGDDVAVA